MYIISSSLVEQRFTGKQSDHTVFGHIPSSANKMYTLWSYLLKNQINAHPFFLKSNAILLYENDFKYIKDFNWSFKLWDKFRKITALPSNILDAYYEII